MLIECSLGYVPQNVKKTICFGCCNCYACNMCVTFTHIIIVHCEVVMT